jgi:hypothetical protein
MSRYLAQVNLRDTLFNTDVNRGITNVSGPFQLISFILPNVFILAGIILFIYLVAGGFILVTSGGNVSNAQQGQQIILNAIIGFVIILMSYWIIQIIEIITGVNLLDPTLVIGA